MRKAIFFLLCGSIAYAQFPNSVPNNNYFGVFTTGVGGHLNAIVQATDTVAYLNNGSCTLYGLNTSCTTAFTSNMVAQMGNEIVQICSVGGGPGNTTAIQFGHSSCPNIDGRGIGGSTPAIAYGNTIVSSTFVSPSYSKILTELQSIESALITGFTFDVNNNPANLCSNNSVYYLQQAWLNSPTQIINCTIIPSGGTLQPALSQVITLTKPPLDLTKQIFDLSITGPGGIKFNPYAPPVRPEWAGATIDTSLLTDHFSGPYLGVYNSLPFRSLNAQNLPTTEGVIKLQNTGLNGAYVTSVPLPMSAYTTLEGTGTNGSGIYTTSGFSPTSHCVFDVTNTNGSGGSANNNFNVVFRNLYIGANLSPGACGISFVASVQSILENSSIAVTNSVGVYVGGNPAYITNPSMDSGIIRNLNFALSGAGISQALVFPNSTLTTSDKISIIKIVGGSSPQVPVVSLGDGNNNLTFDGINCEQSQWCMGIGFEDSNITVESLVASSDSVSGMPRALMISSSASNIIANVDTIGIINGIQIGDFWRASLPVSLGFQIIDSNNNIQQVTTAGTQGATPPTWNTSGTTTDGGAVWTFVAAVQPCIPGVTTNSCCLPYVAINGLKVNNFPGMGTCSSMGVTDVNRYSYYYDSKLTL